ncbi:methylmalonyl-CoA mutase family protein [Sediminitomix flava]|uniref:Heterodimeric methylmalonyl-CoA mutase small subunit n=1 Tax=Sediminitomix flava TaxID=379075 RepID=A0A315ZXQ3_SEDFL|nr:methylmalonyl-CoA mutase family protein [Sediminitomix flava]PWJ42127.1 heterodimeric methylmalonyl-CoA mutase small subunit [Sediminitomix flava]
MEKNLFESFPPLEKAQWVEKATVDLKGADFNKKLLWRTENGYTLEPFYMRSDLQEKSFNQLQYTFPKAEGDAAPRAWVNYRKIKVTNEKEANKTALEALGKRGAEGIIFDLAAVEAPNAEELLTGIYLDCCAVSFENVKNPEAWVRNYVAYAKLQDVPKEKLSGYIKCDLLEKYTETGQLFEEKELVEWAALLSVTQQMPHFYGLALSSQIIRDAGGNHIQEAAFMLNMVAEYLARFADTKLHVEEVIKEVLPISAFGSDYFQEIAKYRALRTLLLEVAKMYDENFPVEQLHIMGVSSEWSKSTLDPNVNLLRNTTEAMSAVLGGCNSIWIAPHNKYQGEENDFSHRIALNISHLLREESYLDKVVDPSAGSYYIEKITSEILERALTLFQDIESKGGFVTCFEAGYIQEKIEETLQANNKLISQRRKVLVGTNRYPNGLETPDIHLVKEESSDKKALKKQRSGIQFEALRLRTEEYVKETGNRPQIELALFGNLAMRKARATFAGDFFQVAGFETQEVPYKSAEEAALLSAKNEKEIVVLCASDDDYKEHAFEFVNAFRRHNTHTMLILAGYPAEIVEELKDAGLDDFIHMRVNTLDSLTALQDRLFN